MDSICLGLFHVPKCCNLATSCLDPAVAPVGDDDVPVRVHGHSGGSIELTVAFAVGAKFEQELSICIVNLGWDISLDERKQTGSKSLESFFTFTE